MATASVQYTFAALTDIKSSEANKNFADLVNFLNNQVIHADASRVFTATPAGPALDPVSADQFVRKAYVDKWGIVAQQKLTASGAGISADGLTDFVLNNVSVVQNHVYAIHLHSQAQLDTTGLWNIGLRVNGVATDHFFTVGQFGTASSTFDSTVYWLAPTTQATDDFTVFADEISGTSTLTFTASATQTRSLTIIGLGPI